MRARALVWLAEADPRDPALRERVRGWRLEVDQYVAPGRQLDELEPSPIPTDVAQRLHDELLALAEATDPMCSPTTRTPRR